MTAATPIPSHQELLDQLKKELLDQLKKELLYCTSGSMLEDRLERVATALEMMYLRGEIITVVADIRRAADLVKERGSAHKRRPLGRHTSQRR